MPYSPEDLLGNGRGLSHIDTNCGALTDQSSEQTIANGWGPSQTLAQRKAAAQAFEEKLHASQPSDLAKLVLQLAKERNAFVVLTVLAARVPGWEEVTPADVVVSPLRSGIVKLSARTASSNADCVFKTRGTAHIRAAHQELSDAGVATTLLACGPGWTAEQFLTGRDMGEGYWETGRVGFSPFAELAARLHAAPTDWWPPFRDNLRKMLPLLNDEPDSSPLWLMAAFAESKDYLSKLAALKENQSQLAELMTILPRPVGELANKIVNVHGDFWDANIVEADDGTLKLVDFESTCVCGAIQDLVHVTHTELIEAYLRETTGQEPTEDELEALVFEARLAEHIHFFILRAIFNINDNENFHPVPASNFFEHAHRLAAVVEAVRANKALRRYVVRGCVTEGEPANPEGGQREELDPVVIKAALVGPVKLLLKSHPGQGMVRQERIDVGGGWGHFLSLGPANDAATVIIEKKQLAAADNYYGEGGPVMDADNYELGLHIAEGPQHAKRLGNAVMLGSWDHPSFTVNPDSTISPTCNPSVVLGHGPCKLHGDYWEERDTILFVVVGSKEQLVFDFVPSAKPWDSIKREDKLAADVATKLEEGARMWCWWSAEQLAAEGCKVAGL
jgi:hypothetical protein